MLSEEEKADLEFFRSLSDDELMSLPDEDWKYIEVLENKKNSGEDYGEYQQPQSDVIAQLSKPYTPGTLEFTDKMTQEGKDRAERELRERKKQIIADWDKLDRHDKAMYLAEKTKRRPEDLANWIATAPNSALNEVMFYELEGDEAGTLSRAVSGVKDMFSAPGRVVGATVDAILSPRDVTGESFTESMGQREGALPEGGEQRNLFGNIAQTIIRDPFAPPMGSLKAPAAIEKVIEKAGKAVAKGPSWAPKVVEGITRGGIQGAAEETTRGVVEGNLDPTTVALGTLLSGGLGGIGGKLQDMAFRKFSNQPSKSMIDKLGGIENAEAPLFSTFEGLGTPIGPDYNISNRINKIKSEQSRLGQMKEGAYQKATDLSNIYANVRGTTATARSFEDEADKIVKLVGNRSMSQEAATNYLNELANVRSQYFENIDRFLPNESTIRETRGDVGKVAKLLEDIPNQRTAAAASASANNIYGGIANTLGMNLEGDILKLFNARKAMDADLQRVYGKAGKGVKLTDKENAYLFGRSQLNAQIDATLDALSNQLQASGDKTSLKALNLIMETLDETKNLPSLYSQEEILRSIGGGRTGKSFDALTKGAIEQALFPASGARQRQIGDLLMSPLFQRQLKEQTYRDDTSPLFGTEKN